MKDKKFFLDTNILVYAHDPSDQYKQKKYQELIFDGIKNDSAVISTQVLNRCKSVWACGLTGIKTLLTKPTNQLTN